MLGKIGLDSRYLAQKSIRPPLFNARSLLFKNISIVNKIKIEARCSLKILLEIYSNDFTLDYGRIHGLFIEMIKLRPVEENKA